MNAQCTITGTTVDSRTITCSTLSGCTIVYIGNGVNPTSLVMYQNLDLTCLGAIQLIIRNNANIDFSNGNYDLRLGANSSIIVENGGNISAGSNCSSSDLIWIGEDKVASCTGAGPDVISFPNLVVGGGYNTVNATSTIVCGSGTSTITAVRNPTPTSTTTYNLYSGATGGTLIQTITTSSPYVASFITPNISSTTNYFIDATTSGITTLRRQVTVTVVPLPTITNTTPNSRCGTGTVTLEATASAGTINWYATSTGGSLLGTGTSFTTPSIAATTTYYVDATNNGCATSSRTAVTATVNPLPATPTITASSSTTFCAGGSVNLTASAGTSYLWSTGATTQSITVSNAGSYTVRVTNAAGCQSAPSTATTVTVNPLPATPTITASSSTTFCAGGSVNLTASTGTSYLWSTGATTQSITVSNAGSYTVQVTNAAGCQSAPSTATTVTVNPLPATPTITAGSSTTFCTGGSVTLTSSLGNSYLWSTGATTQSITVSTGGNYTVQVTNAAGCQSAPSTATTVTVNPLPATPTITAGSSTTFCTGGSVNLTASTGTSYLWSTGATTQSITVSNAGSYTVQVTNAAGCQSAPSTATTVTVNPLPATPTITAGSSTTFCTGGSVTLTSSLGNSYLWSTGATTQSITVSNAGSYTVRVTNAAGCQSAPSTATTVTVNPLPATPTITASSSTTFCAGGSVTLTSSLGNSYLWSTGATTQSITVSNAGSYTVQVTNAAGCQSAPSTATTVTVNPLPATPTITASSSTTFCTGGSVTLTSSIGNSYLWSTGATTQSITVSTGGNYTVQVTNAAGCQSAPSTATTVTVNPLPATPTITASSSTTFCTGGSVILTASAGTSYLWSTGATTQSITVSTGGNYTVQVTNAAGCQSAPSTATTVTVNATNIWNGSTDTIWNNPANWSCGVPTSTSSILIPSGLTNYPLISTEGIIINNIEIQNGALLNVLNNGLTITGILTLNGRIDLQNESQLVQTSTSTLISDCATGKIEIDQQGTSDSFSYNYWGSPVNNTCAVPLTINNIANFLRDGSFPGNIKSFVYNANAFFADIKSTPLNNGIPNIKLSTYWMYKFANKTASDYNSWTYIGNTGPLLTGEGFTLKGSNSTFTNQNYTFVGKPNNGLIELTVNSGMQYLIGNPYPSAIDAREFIKDNIKEYIDPSNNVYVGSRTENIIDGNLYFWDHYGFSSHLLKSYQGGYAIYNLSGGVAFQRGSVSGVPPPPGSGKTPRQFIPVAQGFFVNGLTNSGKIQFNNSQRTYQKEAVGTSEFIRTTGKNKSVEIDLTKRIYLKYNSPSGFQRQLLVAFIPNTTEGIDVGYDAINNERFAEDISWLNAENKFVIQAIPTIENRVLPLEVKVSTKGISKISLDHIDNISEEIAILIKDNLNGMLYNLKTAPFEINLSPGTYTNRFELVLKTQQTLAIHEENIVDNSINIYLNNEENVIYIHKNNAEIKEISIFNMMGQQLKSIKNNLDYQVIKIPHNVQSGVYIVNVTTNNGTVSKKIIKL